MNTSVTYFWLFSKNHLPWKHVAVSLMPSATHMHKYVSCGSALWTICCHNRGYNPQNTIVPFLESTIIKCAATTTKQVWAVQHYNSRDGKGRKWAQELVVGKREHNQWGERDWEKIEQVFKKMVPSKWCPEIIKGYWMWRLTWQSF